MIHSTIFLVPLAEVLPSFKTCHLPHCGMKCLSTWSLSCTCWWYSLCTDHHMNTQARITLTVECIRTCILIFLFHVSIQGRVWSILTLFSIWLIFRYQLCSPSQIPHRSLSTMRQMWFSNRPSQGVRTSVHVGTCSDHFGCCIYTCNFFPFWMFDLQRWKFSFLILACCQCLTGFRTIWNRTSPKKFSAPVPLNIARLKLGAFISVSSFYLCCIESPCNYWVKIFLLLVLFANGTVGLSMNLRNMWKNIRGCMSTAKNAMHLCPTSNLNWRNIEKCTLGGTWWHWFVLLSLIACSPQL